MVPYIVHMDRGGSEVEYHQRGVQLAMAGRTIVVDGPCMSACTVMVSEQRARTCVTLHASFFFHLEKIPLYDARTGEDMRIRVSYPSDIQHWVDTHGGEQRDFTPPMLYQDARNFWRTCTNKDFTG